MWLGWKMPTWSRGGEKIQFTDIFLQHIYLKDHQIRAV